MKVKCQFCRAEIMDGDPHRSWCPVFAPDGQATGRTPWDICACLHCGPPYRAEVPEWRDQPYPSWMALCPTCGSSRCPGATRHDRHPA